MVWYHGTQHKDNQLIALYKKCMIDKEIAEELGVSIDRVSRCRRRLGLKAHGPRLLFTDQQLIELHEQWLIDREIANKLGVAKSTVKDRRRKLGLKAHYRVRL